jgi:hypothetical protein
MSLPTSTDGWVVEPKEAPAALAEDFRALPFVSPEPLHAGDHIRDWASFLELIGPEGMAALAKAVR